MTGKRVNETVLRRNNVKVSGRGTQPMLFAHGFGCDQNMWRFVAPAFEDDYKVVLFDYVGSGKSDLSLRLLDRGFTLVSDDQTLVRREDDRLIASAPPTIADKSAETASQIEALHNEIAKLQADQGARLTAQQAQLEILQQKLAAETKTADQLAAQNEGTPAPATNRVIAVEPASGASEPAANAAATAPGPEPTPNSTPPERRHRREQPRRSQNAGVRPALLCAFT